MNNDAIAVNNQNVLPPLPAISIGDVVRELQTEIEYLSLERKQISQEIYLAGSLIGLEAALKAFHNRNGQTKTWKTIFGASLQDEHGSNIKLELPFPEVLQLQENQQVILRGKPQINRIRNQFFPLLKVSGVYIDNQALGNKGQSLTLNGFISILKQNSPYTKSFPYTKPTLDITLLVPVHGVTDKDFLNQLDPTNQIDININEKRLNLSSSEQLIDFLSTVETDILVILRGGSGADISVWGALNDIEVMTAFNQVSAWKLTGIGHSTDFQSIEILADYSCITPTAAGALLNENLSIRKLIKEYGIQPNKMIIPEYYKQVNQTPRSNQVNRSFALIIFLSVCLILVLIIIKELVK